jgi:hypothetical protein
VAAAARAASTRDIDGDADAATAESAAASDLRRGDVPNISFNKSEGLLLLLLLLLLQSLLLSLGTASVASNGVRCDTLEASSDTRICFIARPVMLASWTTI